MIYWIRSECVAQTDLSRNGGMADAMDSKSIALKSVRVQVPLAALKKESVMAPFFVEINVLCNSIRVSTYFRNIVAYREYL